MSMTFPYSDYHDSDIGWLGRVPAHWTIIRFGLTHLRADLGGNYLAGEGEAGIPVIKMGNIGRGDIQLQKIERLPQSESFDNKHLLTHGDFLFNTRNSLDLVGKVAVWREELESAVYNSNILRIQFDSRFIGNPYFAVYLFNSPLVLGLLRLFAKGTTNVAAIYYKDLRQITLSLPPVNEQNTIAAFLDYETAKIDGLIEKQQQLIALLKEKRQAVISHAVTKGLNPAVPMRHSGVEWLGEVPAHWDCCTLRRYATFVDGDRGSDYPNENDLANQGVLFLSSKNIVDGSLDLSEAKFISQKKFDVLNRGKALDGDLIVKVRGSTGRIGELAIFDIDECGFQTAFINAQMMIIRTDSKLISKYLRFVSQSSYWTEQLYVGAYGTAQQQLSNKIFLELSVAVPPVSDQVAIIHFLEMRVGALKSLETNAIRAVELLQERRTALISAAVTGKIDVRNWQPPQPNPNTLSQTETL